MQYISALAAHWLARVQNAHVQGMLGGRGSTACLALLHLR